MDPIFGNIYDTPALDSDLSPFELDELSDLGVDVFGADGDIAAELASLEAEAADEDYGYYGAEEAQSVQMVQASVVIPKAKNAFFYPESVKDAAEFYPDWIKIGVFGSIENEALNLAQELDQKVDVSSGGYGFPANFNDQVAFVRSIVQRSIIPEADDSAAYERLAQAWEESGGEWDERIKQMLAGGWDAIKIWYTEDLPNLYQVLFPTATGGNEAFNAYAVYLCCLDLAGVNAFESITHSLLDQGAIVMAKASGPGRAAPGAVGPAYESEDVAPKKAGWLDKIEPVHLVAGGYLLGVGLPVAKAIFSR